MVSVWRPYAGLHPTLSAPQQNVETGRVAVAAAFADLDQPEGFAEHFVCCDGLRHEKHPFRGEGERCCQGINLSHIGRLVHDKFKIGSASIAEEMQDWDMDASFVRHTGVREFGRDVELMRQSGTLDIGEGGEPSRFDLNGKTCCSQDV